MCVWERFQEVTSSATNLVISLRALFSLARSCGVANFPQESSRRWVTCRDSGSTGVPFLPGACSQGGRRLRAHTAFSPSPQGVHQWLRRLLHQHGQRDALGHAGEAPQCRRQRWAAVPDPPASQQHRGARGGRARGPEGRVPPGRQLAATGGRIVVLPWVCCIKRRRRGRCSEPVPSRGRSRP